MSDTQKRGAILISGRGSNMVSLLHAAEEKDFPVTFDLVISDKIEAAGLGHATAAGVRTHALRALRQGQAAWEEELQQVLDEAKIDLICLAGFMRLLSARFVERWAGKILNIHPSLLPHFPGLNAQAQALDAGVSEAGCTVHVVTAEMDAGPVLGQARVPVNAGDSVDALSARILGEEHRLYPAMVAKYVHDNWLTEDTIHAG
ncbi:MAG: phosphoribosylglycinamide formyltransferase [Alphaproteobacteria bacterium TMED89]|nr:phosphoribosylglycinamide formyltransferase [Rhodospirillaceae bacterium]RPH18682.1 MAG: phosphoribosylglycinamide formyltransferase [Alphaproteobacteria bacterium TMED89]